MLSRHFSFIFILGYRIAYDHLLKYITLNSVLCENTYTHINKYINYVKYLSFILRLELLTVSLKYAHTSSLYSLFQMGKLHIPLV